MKKLKTYIKELIKSNNLLKVISLSLGLSILLVLFSKISFNLDYNSCYPDADRIYLLNTKMTMGNEVQDLALVSGGVPALFKREIPEIEVATRYTYISKGNVYDESKNKYKGTVICADTCLFELFPHRIIQGNAKETLLKPMHALVSQSLAKKIGKDIIGKKIELETHPGKSLIIDGIFEDIPKNTSDIYDVIVGMSSFSLFKPDWGDAESLVGSETFKGFVKLQKGTNPASLADAIYKAQVDFQGVKDFEEFFSIGYSYRLDSLGDPMNLHPELKRNVLLLSILVFSLLFVSVANYILATLSSLMDKTKNIAIHKCFGAGNFNIYKMLSLETLFYVLTSLGIAGILILSFRGLIEYLFGINIIYLFTLKACLYLFLILIFIYIIITSIPSFIFAKTPTIAIINAYKGKKGNWKKILLSIQFIAAVFLTTLVVIIMLQYNKMTKEDHGFRPEKLIYFFIPDDSKNVIIEKLKQLPIVEQVTRATNLPAIGKELQLSGVWFTNDMKRGMLFVATHFYGIDEHFVPTMGIEMKSGTNFTTDSSPNSVIISEMFEKRLIALGWTDGVLEKEIMVSDYYNIIGVYKEVKAGTTISTWYNRPSIFSYSTSEANYIVVRLNQINYENLQSVQKILKEAAPDLETNISIYGDSLISQYDEENKLKESVLLAGIFTLLITCIGLVIYLNNEIQRRRFEIAVRRVNGASLLNILSIFTKEILVIFIPMSILASIGAYYAANKWMEDFVLKIDMHYGIFILCSVAILIITLIITIINCGKISNDNPIESLKPEN